MNERGRTWRERLADDRSGAAPEPLMAMALLIGGVPAVWWASAPGPWELQVTLIGLVLLLAVVWVVIGLLPFEQATGLYVPALVITGVLAALVVAGVVAVRWAT